MFARIALLCAPYLSLTYTLPAYFPAAFWKQGMRVALPLGRQQSLKTGVILSFPAADDLPQGLNYRDLFWPLERKPLLSLELLNLARELGARQGADPALVLGHVLPQGLRGLSGVLHRLKAQGAESLELKKLVRQPLAVIEQWAALFLKGEAEILPKKQDAASSELCFLTVEPPWPVRPAALRQQALLDYLFEHGPVSRKILTQSFGPGTSAVLKALLGQNCLALKRDEPEDLPPALALPPDSADFKLNAEQEAAFRACVEALGTCATRLLYGVTGSGKTAVYLSLAKICLERGLSVFLLAPELALACKLRRDALAFLPGGTKILFYHGYQSPARREASFREMAEASGPCLVIGTRSALFLPASRLGCIILDEEHDASFKQDEGLNYHAKEVAWFRARQHKALLLLGSATPDLKTFHAAQNGRIPMLRLAKRVGECRNPALELVDLRKLEADASCLLAPETEAALRTTIEAGEQAVILLNRRGYAPLLYCQNCARSLRCPECDIGLTYHKARGKLLCHYCGYARDFPSPCPDCKGMNFLPLGEGTERLAEQLAQISSTRILRLDRDSTRQAGSLEAILEAFARRESPILVGTQMLSKGHHFPLVTLAVVVDGDLGLNLPDYRAAERSFQLLLQCAGRAGRGERPGRVLIQTRNPGLNFWEYLLRADYASFASQELALRQKREYPPFVCLGLLRLSFASADDSAHERLSSLAQDLRKAALEFGLRMRGPAPAPLAMLRGRKRFICLLKCASWQPMRQLYLFAQRHPEARNMQLTLDLDPQNML